MLCFQVLHEDWWFAFKSFQHQFRDQLHAWQRDRDDLFLKIKAVFAEANSGHEAEKDRFTDRHKQMLICESLHEKVRQNLFSSKPSFRHPKI